MFPFLQTYGLWIVLIALFLLMIRMHGGCGGHGIGGCCGMGGMEQDQSAHHHQSRAEPKSSDEPPRVVTSAENEDQYRSYQQEQPRVRVLPPLGESPGHCELNPLSLFVIHL